MSDISDKFNDDKDRFQDSLFERKNTESFKGFFLDEFVQSFKDTYSDVKDTLHSFKESFISGLDNSAIEIFYLALLGTLIAFPLSYEYQADKNHQYKLAFSETTSIEKDAEQMGIQVPHVTDFLTKASDTYMKVIECWNDSWQRIVVGDNVEMFADEIMMRVDPVFKNRHYEFPQLGVLVPKLADMVVKDFGHLRGLQNNLSITVEYFESAWHDSHQDIYRTETRTEFYTDSDGNSQTRTVVEQVYDHTINRYIYYKWAGNNASAKLDSTLVWFPEISMKGHFMPAKETGPENEFAIERSRKDELEGKSLSKEELLKEANSWMHGSTIYNDLLAMRSLHGHLKNNSSTWRIHKRTAHSDVYITKNYSHAEPKEFQTTEITMDNGRALSYVIDSMFESITYTKNNVNNLIGKINDLVAVYDKFKEGDMEEMMEDIMDTAKKGYETLYPKGVKLDNANWLMVLPWTLLGTLIGGVVGYSLHKFMEYRGGWRKNQIEPRRNYENFGGE